MLDESQYPLVTFALFAYNQEKYIREAVEGALRQDYQNLEIILSDDCSDDCTFRVMESIATEYTGPHRLLVRRNRENLGIIDHLVTVARISAGRLLVVAAGDDVSYPGRVTALAEAWTNNGAVALYSGCDEVDDSGELLRRGFFPQPLIRIQRLFSGCTSPRRYNGLVRNIPGYSAAYLTEFIKEFPLAGAKINNEDALTTYVANLRGNEIHEVKQVLMARRESLTSVSAYESTTSFAAAWRRERVIAAFAASTVRFLDYFGSLAIAGDCSDFELVRERLEEERNYLELVSRFWDQTYFSRLAELWNARSLRNVKFVLPRLLGREIFCAVRVFLK